MISFVLTLVDKCLRPMYYRPDFREDLDTISVDFLRLPEGLVLDHSI